MNTKRVSGCGTCPFVDDGSETDGKWMCHGEYDENGWPRDLGAPVLPPVTPPDWCVLRRGPVLVQLVTKPID